jgi:hypothetical protein
LILLVLLGLAACDLSQEPEVRTNGNDLEQIGAWSATVAPVQSAALRGTLNVREFGSYSEVEVSITDGAPSTSYQWRIFRGTCAVTTPLTLHSTIQAYPDLVTNGSGQAAAQRQLGGSLSWPTGEYSLRIRVATSLTNWNGTSPIACGDLQRS